MTDLIAGHRDDPTRWAVCTTCETNTRSDYFPKSHPKLCKSYAPPPPKTGPQPTNLRVEPDHSSSGQERLTLRFYTAQQRAGHI
jgi:hypothetical protein